MQSAESGVTGHVYFSHDGIRVIVAQPWLREARSQQRAAYNAGGNQCWLRLLAHPPREFDVKMTGSASSPVIEVIVLRNLLHKLPVLSEIDVSTGRGQNQSDEEAGPGDATKVEFQAAELHLPGSVWGMVSLLLLLENDTQIKPWFSDTGSDPGLVQQTLQAAEFLGCDEMRDSILQWLRDSFLHVVQHGGSTAALAEHSIATSLHNSFSHIWHLTEVLQHVDGNHVKEVFSALEHKTSGMAAAAHAAMNLPQDLLVKWIQSAAPTIDVRDAQFSHIQLACLANAVAHPQCSAVTTLHFPMVGRPQPVVHSSEMERFRHLLMYWSSHRSTSSFCCSCGRESHAECTKLSVGFQCHSPSCRQFCATIYAPVYEIKSILAMHSSPRSIRSCSNFYERLKEFCDAAPDTQSYCCGCKGTFWGKPSLVMVGFSCSSCGKMCPVRTSRPPQVPVLSLIAGGWCTKVCSDAKQVLCSLAGAASGMRTLQHLGLHNLPLSVELMAMLGHILGSLRNSLIALTLDAYVVDNTKFGVAEKALLFAAVARAQKLQKLHMMQWEELVGMDAEACASELHGLLHMQAIVVPEVKCSAVFPAPLPFHTAEHQGEP